MSQDPRIYGFAALVRDNEWSIRVLSSFEIERLSEAFDVMRIVRRASKGC